MSGRGDREAWERERAEKRAAWEQERASQRAAWEREQEVRRQAAAERARSRASGSS